MLKFNPFEWLNQQKPANQPPSPEKHKTTSNSAQVDLLVAEIEQQKLDIAPSYNDWLNVGFALASEFGEGGRDYYHNISQFYPQYTHKECDEQYTKCLKAHGIGITIGTLFHLATQAGIVLTTTKKQQINNYEPQETATQLNNTPQDEVEFETHAEVLPTFPPWIYDKLPDLLVKCTEPFKEPQMKDAMLLGALTAFSSSIPFVYSIYDGKKLYPNLYLFITAPASASTAPSNPVHSKVSEFYVVRQVCLFPSANRKISFHGLH